MPNWTLPFFEWCDRSWLGTAVRDNVWAFPIIETFHLLALAVLLGSVLIVNLRTFGLGSRFGSLADLARDLMPWMTVSIAIMLLTGIPMMMSEPMKCFESTSFPVKMTLLVIAIGFHFAVQRKWATGNVAASRLAALVSIFLWTCISFAGKGIPYV